MARPTGWSDGRSAMAAAVSTSWTDTPAAGYTARTTGSSSTTDAVEANTTVSQPHSASRNAPPLTMAPRARLAPIAVSTAARVLTATPHATTTTTETAARGSRVVKRVIAAAVKPPVTRRLVRRSASVLDRRPREAATFERIDDVSQRGMPPNTFNADLQRVGLIECSLRRPALRAPFPRAAADR